MDSNKSKALEAALGQIERQFGKGSTVNGHIKAFGNMAMIL